MLNTKLILIDGITGSGKSTTAQFLAKQLKKNGVKSKWYHETQTDHPLEYEEDVEVFDSQADMDKFLETIPKLWRQFVEQVSQSDEVHIIESFLLQDTVRLLFQNNLEEERIIGFVQEIEDIIRPLNPALIYFHQQDANRSIRMIWKRRGDDWKKWFIDSDIQTPYVKSSGLVGEVGAIKLWSDYQNFTNQLFDIYQFKKISIENSASKWDEYYQKILDFLDLNLVVENRDLTLEEMKRYCGDYKEQEGKLECSIKLLNGNLVCNLIWPDIRILPVENEDDSLFYLESFPVFIKFKENEEGYIKSLSLSGKRKNLDGKELEKIHAVNN
ncbi:hypothetical protein [Sporosalibacterium faouarense]|uniref:hypothetical protein n=1 Tax=Sporosalibacterium faouarense TaxID=516123 RepID=UPI00141C2F7D|nr:hypothetical protein [Sporosalibacterium faouarense]MTI46251.1 hypothetical protein [Bacillota bacterium]